MPVFVPYACKSVTAIINDISRRTNLTICRRFHNSFPVDMAFLPYPIRKCVKPSDLVKYE